MGKFFITGDTHGNFDRIERFCNRFKTTKEIGRASCRERVSKSV